MSGVKRDKLSLKEDFFEVLSLFVLRELTGQKFYDRSPEPLSIHEAERHNKQKELSQIEDRALL